MYDRYKRYVTKKLLIHTLYIYNRNVIKYKIKWLYDFFFKITLQNYESENFSFSI